MTGHFSTNKIRTVLGFAVFLGFMGLPACSKVQFGNASTATVAAACSTANPCVSISGGVSSFDFAVSAASQAVDIIFVIDNSASMFSIQTQISQRFSTLFDEIKNYDYRIAITTTDISSATNGPRAINGNGALQNGNFIRFSDGSNVLTPSSTNPESLFEAAIMRPETLSCDNYVNTCNSSTGCTDSVAYGNACPSEDTRAIAALNMALSNNQSGFFRSGVPLTAVIVSNADERAAGGRVSAYPLQANDEPSSFVSAFQSTYGSTVALAVDSIIIEPNDTACYRSQSFTPTLFGWYGLVYQQLSTLTGGVVGDICATDYSSSLSSIGASAAKQIKSIGLPCAASANGLTLEDSTTSQPIGFTLSSDSQSLILAQPLSSGETVKVHGQCNS